MLQVSQDWQFTATDAPIAINVFVLSSMGQPPLFISIKDASKFQQFSRFYRNFFDDLDSNRRRAFLHAEIGKA